MPSLLARSVAFMLRTTGTYKKMFSGGPGFPARQAKLLAVPSAPAAKHRKLAHVEESRFQDRPVFTLSPKDRPVSAHVLFWHGGGYVFPASPVHWDFFAHMASVHGWSVTAPLYPLAPMESAERIGSFALNFYRDYAERRAGAPFAMAGDSAGGGLTAATLMAARDAGLALPDKAVLICPWLDVVPGHPDQRHIEARDAILTLQGIKEAGEMFAGALGLNDPRVSPLHGDWHGLPPMLAFAGTADILLTDSRALKAKLPAIDYVEGEDMIHDWPLFFFRESREAQARMAAFASA